MNDAEKLKALCDQQKRDGERKQQEEQRKREWQQKPDPFLEGLTGE